MIQDEEEIQRTSWCVKDCRQDELRFEGEERLRAEERVEKLEESKEEMKWKKVSFVMGMAYQHKLWVTSASVE